MDGKAQLQGGAGEAGLGVVEQVTQGGYDLGPVGAALGCQGDPQFLRSYIQIGGALEGRHQEASSFIPAAGVEQFDHPEQIGLDLTGTSASEGRPDQIN